MRELTKFEKLYMYVMQGARSKEDCANTLGVTTKTVENIVAKYSDIIYYNKQHHKYSLVGYITHRIPPILLYYITRSKMKELNLPISHSLTLNISDTPIPVSELEGSWMMEIIKYTQKQDATQ